MNDKAKPETLRETFPHALAGYLTRNGQVGNLPDLQHQIEDFMRDAKVGISPAAPLSPQLPSVTAKCASCGHDKRDHEPEEDGCRVSISMLPMKQCRCHGYISASPAPESDTRGEVPDRQRSKLDPLVLLIARIKSIHGNVSDALSQQRILHELGRLLKLAYSIEASVLSELSALREENERLRAELAEMTEDRNLWASEHSDDCPNKTLLELAESDLATLRKENAELDLKYRQKDAVIKVLEDLIDTETRRLEIETEDLKEQLSTLRASASSEGPEYIWERGYLAGALHVSEDLGADLLGIQIPPYTPPTATNPEKATSDRSQG